MRGRYSSRALGPEELLQQLDDAAVPPVANGPLHATKVTRQRQFQSRSPHPRYTNAVEKLRSSIMNADRGANVGEVQDTIRPTLLEAIADERDLNSFIHLRNDRAFKPALARYTGYAYTQWLDSVASNLRSAGQQSSSHTRAQHTDPIMLLQLCLLMDMNFRNRCSRTLWILSRDLSEFYSRQGDQKRTLSNCEKDSVHQLMSVWNLCIANELLEGRQEGSIQQFVLGQIRGSDPLSWSFLPEPDTFVEILQSRAPDPLVDASLETALRFLCGVLGRSDSRPSGAESASPALLTLHVLQMLERQSSETEFLLQFQPWTELMSKVVDSIADRRIPYALKSQFNTAKTESERVHYQSIFDKFRLRSGSLHHNTSALPSRGKEADGTASPLDSIGKNPGHQEPVLSREDQMTRRFTYLSISRLGRNLEQQDVKAAERVKQEVISFNQKHKGVQIPLQLYEHLLLTFLSLRRFQVAVDCWKMMLEAGHVPTVKTYTIVIRHSRNARKTNVMEYFWNQMRSEGLQPDVHAWSARLFGLFHKGQLKQGLEALSQMGHEWLAAVRAAQSRGQAPEHPTQIAALAAQSESEVDGVPKPNVYALNAAVGGLITAGMDGTVPEVLSWGRKFGIEPDVVTHNKLIHNSMRAGRRSEAISILQRMKDKNLEPNEETWVLLVVDLFENASMEALTPLQQEQKVLELIKSLENDGMNIGQKAYAVVLDRFLKRYNNINAAQAVLTHMASKGIALNQYQCTIVMTAYFQQDPPDFAAIENLWNHMKQQNNGHGMVLGSQFYDRMIEGYAVHHKAVGMSPMMYFLAEMERRGQKPSWLARTAIARALAERRDWDRLLQMVSSVRQTLRAENVGGTTTGQHDFWQFVVSTGLLRGEGITDASQITEENLGADTRRS